MRKRLPLLLLLAAALVPVMLLVQGCNKNNDSTPLTPYVTVNPIVSNLKDTTVRVDYQIQNFVVGTVTSYGVCWSSSKNNPTTADSKTNIATSPSAVNYTATINGLAPNTLYYVRAYAVMNSTTYYSAAVQVSTLKTGGGNNMYGTVSTFAGQTIAGYGNGAGTAATLSNPQGIAVDNAGNLYVADTYNNSIRKITPAGVVSYLAGNGAAGYTDGNAASAQFYAPQGIAVDASGNVYVADVGNNAIRKITPAGVVSTLAGGKFSGFVDGTGSDARFSAPTGVAVDASGNLYVTDRVNSAIRKVTPAGAVTTFAGTNTVGYIDSTGTNALFRSPTGIVIDGANLYVTDLGNYAIRKIVISSAKVSTLLGNPTPSADVLNSPVAIASDQKGKLFITDQTGRILMIGTNNVLYNLGGNAATYGFADGDFTAAKFDSPQGLAVDASGNVYVADNNNNRIRKIVVKTAP